MNDLPKIPALSVVYGGQWGSEGKGQVLAALVRDELARQPTLSYVVRVGGPNAGHTARGLDGNMFAVQSVPLPAFLHPRYCIPVIGAGGLVNPHVLDDEMRLLKHTIRTHLHEPPFENNIDNVNLLYLDEMAMLVSPKHEAEEQEGGKLQAHIGSTTEGVGAALAEKIRRRPGVQVARDVPGLECLGLKITDTVRMLNNSYLPIFVEGTQGHLLSLHTSGFYPHCTSRECGPIGILADIGLSPFAAKQYRSIAVFRSFPIRVGGNSGEMKNEVDWDWMSEYTNGYTQPEITTVTKRVRRIARWDAERNRQTVLETRPTEIAITFLDYLWPNLAEVKAKRHLDKECIQWLKAQQEFLGVPITYVSTGPGQENCFRIDL